jgi:hypothetical protein
MDIPAVVHKAKLFSPQSGLEPLFFEIRFGFDGRHFCGDSGIVYGDKSIYGLVGLGAFPCKSIFNPHIDKNFH